MAGLIPAGVVVDPSKDVFPSTGEHLDVRVIPQFGPQKGKKIDPRTARTLLQNVLIGANKIPLVQQAGSDWKWNFPVTSEFGKRSAPTAGASTYHEGIDIGVGAGTPLTYKGYGTYRPDRGFGALSVADAQGNPYEIRLLHTAPGKAAAVGSTQVPSAPQLPGSTGIDTDQRTQDILEAFMKGTQYELNPREQAKKKETIASTMKRQLLGQVLNQALNPMSFLDNYRTNDPFMQGNAMANQDILSGMFG
jgi:hypothetical protein